MAMAEDRRTYYREYMRARRAEQRRHRLPKPCAREGCPHTFEIARGKRYCSVECERMARLQRRRDTEYQPAPKVCAYEECGQPVPYKSGRRRFCSTACQNAARDKAARWKAKGLDPKGEHAQATACALCGSMNRRLRIDHDHRCCPGERSCGKCVREMLCQPCNVGLGMFGDDPAMLRRAAAYLDRFPLGVKQ